MAVLRFGTAANAGAKTLADLVSNATRSARQLKQLRLIVEEHLQVASTVAEQQGVAQLPQRFFHTLGADERTIINVGVFTCRSAHDHQLWRLAFRELDERIVPAVTLHRDVVARPEPLDHSQLLQQRRELTGRVVPLDLFGRAENSRAFLLGVRA